MNLGRSLLALALLAASLLPARAEGIRLPRKVDLREMVRQVSPGHLVRTARTNYREGRYYATDLSEHPTWRAALKRSIAPVDMRSNVRGAVLKAIHPMRFIGNLTDPLAIELQRQIASGEGLNGKRLLKALHPTMILSTMAGGTAGDIAGSIVQSSLARLGPVGAAVGFFARPALGFAGQILGMNVGESMVSGNKTFRASLAKALRDIKPARDGGMLIGGTIGGTLGQVLIPIPLVGGIIGGMVGGLVGTLVGTGLTKLWPFSALDRLMRSGLSKLAGWIDDSKPPKAPAPAPASPPAPATTASAPRVAPDSSFHNPLRDDGPSMADLPVATR